jgi:hypothetical protein
MSSARLTAGVSSFFTRGVSGVSARCIRHMQLALVMWPAVQYASGKSGSDTLQIGPNVRACRSAVTT